MDGLPQQPQHLGAHSSPARGDQDSPRPPSSSQQLPPHPVPVPPMLLTGCCLVPPPCRFIVENYNLRYLLNEVPEKDKLHPVALPAFPSTAPTGHVRRQVREEVSLPAARKRVLYVGCCCHDEQRERSLTLPICTTQRAVPPCRH